ncbi:MAG: hypothetical protein ACI8TP_001710 [Acidimicrobiales bacterium]|jgi:hypothetical protein
MHWPAASAGLVLLMDPRMGQKRWLGVTVLAGVLLVSGLMGVLSVRVALEDRTAAAAARELQVSAMRIGAADAIVLAGGNQTEAGLEQAVEALAGDHTRALASLSPSDAASAQALLLEIAGCGTWLLDPGDEVHEIHDHGELQALLDQAATSADADASSAERNAAIALIAALSASLTGLWRFAKSRNRMDRRHSEAVSEARTARQFVALVGDSPDAFMVITPNGYVSYRSASSEHLLPTGIAHRDDIVALADSETANRLRSHLQRTDAVSASEVFELTDIKGTTGCFELRVSDLTGDPAVGGHVITARDV